MEKNKEIQELINKIKNENIHIFDMRNKLDFATHKQDMKDIEMAFLMFMSDMYLLNCKNLDDVMDRVDFFADRLKNGVKFFYEMGMTSWDETIQ